MAGTEVEFHLVIRSEIEIGAPPPVVWGYLDRPRDWKPSIVSIEHLDGPPGQEGETLRIGQRPVDETVYVIMRTLRLEPYARRVQTLTTEASRATDGFVIYTLAPLGTSTRLACEVVARCVVPSGAIAGRTAAEFTRVVNEATAAKLDADHHTLKALIERRS
ncbi:MAG: SRPBCC family protein [Betaproteobacteria bacterium]